MAESNLVKPDGSKLGEKSYEVESEEVPSVDLPLVGYVPFRLANAQGIVENKVPPKEAVLDTLFQTNDQMTVLLAGMYAIAHDVYSRQPQGSREAQKYFESLGVRFFNSNMEQINPAAELEKI